MVSSRLRAKTNGKRHAPYFDIVPQHGVELHARIFAHVEQAVRIDHTLAARQQSFADPADKQRDLGSVAFPAELRIDDVLGRARKRRSVEPKAIARLDRQHRRVAARRRSVKTNLDANVDATIDAICDAFAVAILFFVRKSEIGKDRAGNVANDLTAGGPAFSET